MKKLMYRVVSDTNIISNILSDPEFVLTYTPYIVGRSRDYIVIEYRRFKIFKFRDKYRIRIDKNDKESKNSVLILFLGEKSAISITYIFYSGRVDVLLKVDSPRKWLSTRLASNIAEALLEEADRKALRIQAGIEIQKYDKDYSHMLSKASTLTRLLMNSILAKTEIRYFGKGDLLSFIEDLVVSESFRKYPAIYVSGEGDKYRFRLLFVDGELRGIYVTIDGKEYINNEEVLNEINGLIRIRIYGILKKPETITVRA